MSPSDEGRGDAVDGSSSASSGAPTGEEASTRSVASGHRSDLSPAHRADILEEAEGLIDALRAHDDVEVRESVERLLECIDVVHRNGLTHLVSAIHGMAGDAFLHRLCGDPAIRLLLMSYDLVAVDRRIMTEEALDPVRGHLHDHGIDLELTEVVGGVVYVRLHPPVSDQELLGRIRRDIEKALQDGLPGFQELEIGDRHPTSGLVQMGGLRKARRPVYRDVADALEVAEGALHAVMVDELPLLLARVEDGIHAVRNRCGDSPLPLEFSELEDHTLVCSWHGCRYDVRTGAAEGAMTGLDVFPVRVRAGRVEVAVATKPAASGED